jgi:hypothetical protein
MSAHLETFSGLEGWMTELSVDGYTSGRSRYDGGDVIFTLVTLMAPFLAPAKARVERRQDLANMVGNLAEAGRR